MIESTHLFNECNVYVNLDNWATSDVAQLITVITESTLEPHKPQTSGIE